MGKAQQLIENINWVTAPSEVFEVAIRQRKSGNIHGPAVNNGTIQGAHHIAAGQHDAHQHLVDSIHMSAKPKISREDATHVANFYLKKKLAKLDHISRRGTVKHGAYLDSDVIHKALHMAKNQ